MYQRFVALRARSIARILSGTTFCEECGQVCPRDCRREALREQYRNRALRADLFHL